MPSVTAIHRDAAGLVVMFDPAAAEVVQEVVEAERLCCSTIDWQLECDPGVSLRISASPLRLDTLHEMFTMQPSDTRTTT